MAAARLAIGRRSTARVATTVSGRIVRAKTGRASTARVATTGPTPTGRATRIVSGVTTVPGVTTGHATRIAPVVTIGHRTRIAHAARIAPAMRIDRATTLARATRTATHRATAARGRMGSVRTARPEGNDRGRIVHAGPTLRGRTRHGHMARVLSSTAGRRASP